MIQFLNIEPAPFTTYFGKSPYVDPFLKMRKTPTPVKNPFVNQKVPPVVQGVGNHRTI